MTPELALNLRNCAAARAHLAGAEWVTTEKDVQALLEKANNMIREANVVIKEAAALRRTTEFARSRYFRELTTVDLLGGHIPSPFDPRA